MINKIPAPPNKMVGQETPLTGGVAVGIGPLGVADGEETRAVVGVSVEEALAIKV